MSKKTKTITMNDIEQAIDKAVEAVKVFKGSRDELVVEVINPLQATLSAGTKAGLYCNARLIKTKFSKLEKALMKFDERPSETAMRVSKSKSGRRRKPAGMIQSKRSAV